MTPPLLLALALLSGAAPSRTLEVERGSLDSQARPVSVSLSPR